MISPADDVDPASARSVEEFAQCLRRVRVRADNISYRDLEQWGRRHGAPLPRSTLVDVLAARRLPRKPLLLAFLAACGISPETDPRWERAWNRLSEYSHTQPSPRLGPIGPGGATASTGPPRETWTIEDHDETIVVTAEVRAERILAEATARREAAEDEIVQMRTEAHREIDRMRAQAAQDVRGRRLARQLAADVRAAGLRRIGANYLNELEWRQLFTDVTELDVFVAYGQTWRNLHARELDELAQRSSSRIRVFLPDTDDDSTITVLADRFAIAPAELITRIESTRDAYVEMRRPAGARIEVYYRRGDRMFSFYRLDHTAVVGFYSHSRTRLSSVPVLVCEAPGGLHQFIIDELQVIEEQSWLV